MSEKTFLGNEINFNKAPVFWAGMEVYPGNNAKANFYGTLNVVKNSQELNIPDINTDGNLKVNLSGTINKNLKVNGQSTFNDHVKMNKTLLLANCGDVAKRIDRADALPTSDKSLKTNIVPISNALDKVLQLKGVEFDFINNNDYGYLQKHQIGLIAQDVQRIVPEVVAKNKNGTLGVSYEHLVSLLVEAIKEQQKQIIKLKNEIVKR
jgi:hypothetical protein